MLDRKKTKEQLMNELVDMRQRIVELEGADNLKRITEEVNPFAFLFGQQTKLFDEGHSIFPDHFFIYNKTKRCIYASPLGLQTWGLVQTDIVGKALRELKLPSEITELFDKKLESVLFTGQTLTGEIKFPFTDSDIRYYEYILRSVNGCNDEAQAVVVFIKDITELKRKKNALLEKEAQLCAIVKAVDGFMYICSKDYRIEFMNDRLIKRTGYNGIGELCYKIFHDRNLVCPWCVNDKVFKGETVRLEVQSPKDNRWYYSINTPIYHADGTTISKHGVFMDITERKLAEEELYKKKKELEIANKKLTATNSELQAVREELSCKYK